MFKYADIIKQADPARQRMLAQGIGRAGEVYDKLTPAQRLLLAQSGKRIAVKIKDKLFTDTTQQQQQ